MVVSRWVVVVVKMLTKTKLNSLSLFQTIPYKILLKLAITNTQITSKFNEKQKFFNVTQLSNFHVSIQVGIWGVYQFTVMKW